MTVSIDSVDFCRKAFNISILDSGKTDIIHGVNEVRMGGKVHNFKSDGIVCVNANAYAVGIMSDGRKVLMVGE